MPTLEDESMINAGVVNVSPPAAVDGVIVNAPEVTRLDASRQFICVFDVANRISPSQFAEGDPPRVNTLVFVLRLIVALPPTTEKLVPSKTNPVPLVATLLPFRYSTPLAVPLERVRLPDSVAVPALTEAMDAPVTVSPVITAVPTLADATLAPVAVKLVTVPVVISATPTLAEATEAAVLVRFVTVPVVINATPAFTEAAETVVALTLPVKSSITMAAVPSFALTFVTSTLVASTVVAFTVVMLATDPFMEAIDALVAVRLLITATPALMEAMEAAVN